METSGGTILELKKDYVYKLLRQSIFDGTLQPGYRLPPEVSLAKELEVGQVTLRSALAKLEQEGLVERVRSKGTFVSRKKSGKSFLFIIPDGAEDLETRSRYIAGGIDDAALHLALTIERCPLSLFMTFSPHERKEMVKNHNISGVILETGHRKISPETIKALQELKLPVVIPHGLPTDAAESGFLVLRTDERMAFYRAYEYIASCGHKNVASLFIRMPGEVDDQPRGFMLSELQDWAETLHLNTDPALVAYLPNDYELIRKQLQNWLRQPEAPTAIMCHSDKVAMRSAAILREMNVALPEKISLMGYSNFPGSQLITPALATIDTRLRDCAALALQQLLKAKEWFVPGKTPEEIFTPFVLIKRNSVAVIKEK